jgi:FkbM family methyltransferase
MKNEQIFLNSRKFIRRNFYEAPEGSRVIRAVVHGETVYFCIATEKDTIQGHHAKGMFYEREELAIIARHFPIGGVFLDIGANIGNHALYVAKFLHAQKVHLIEPNPPAIDLLEANIYLNQLEGICDMSEIGVGLSDEHQSGLSMNTPPTNLGGARMKASGGDLDVYRADDLYPDLDVDFVKIDVEGMEISVLNGMSGLINRCSPKMFIEVDTRNDEAFRDWCALNRYEIQEEFKRYAVNTNYLIARNPQSEES